MAVPFEPKLDVYEAGVAGTITFRDISNYNNNTDGVTADTPISRGVQVVDLNNIVIGFLYLTLQTDGLYGGTYTLTKDMYYTYNIQIILPPEEILLGTTKYVSVGFYNASFITIMENKAGDCGCNSGDICTDLTWAMHNRNAAIIFADKGMGINSQKAIDAANIFLTNTLFC